MFNSLVCVFKAICKQCREKITRGLEPKGSVEADVAFKPPGAVPQVSDPVEESIEAKGESQYCEVGA